MIFIFNFAGIQTFNDCEVHCGARFRESDFLLRDIIICDNAFAMQLLQGIHNLTETAVELLECVINL